MPRGMQDYSEFPKSITNGWREQGVVEAEQRLLLLGRQWADAPIE